MAKVRDTMLKLDFEAQPTHTIIYDPEEDKATMAGRNGEFEVVRVVEDNRAWYLPLSNKTLARQLIPIDKVSRLKITRTGLSYDTKFTVENLGPPQAQAKVR